MGVVELESPLTFLSLTFVQHPLLLSGDNDNPEATIGLEETTDKKPGHWCLAQGRAIVTLAGIGASFLAASCHCALHSGGA